MKIIQLIQKPQARGAEIFACHLSVALENLGHQVLLISLFEGDYKLPFQGSQIHLNLGLYRRLWDISLWKKLGKIITDFSPDLVQANGADTLKFAVFSRKFSKNTSKLIFNNGGVVTHYIDSWLKKLYNQYLFGQVDGLVSVSAYSKKDLDCFISKAKPHEVIPVGINCKDVSSLREPSSFPTLIHIAGFTPEKNHQGVLRIFERFLLEVPNAELWFIGDGPLRKTIEALVNDCNEPDQVKFLGAVANPFVHIPANALVILPSKIEGVPAVILEAFHHQLPVFAYGVGGIPDILEDEVTGFLIDSDHEEAFAKRLVNYLDMNRERKSEILENAKKLLEQNYQIPQIAIRYQKYYTSLCV